MTQIIYKVLIVRNPDRLLKVYIQIVDTVS